MCVVRLIVARDALRAFCMSQCHELLSQRRQWGCHRMPDTMTLSSYPWLSLIADRDTKHTLLRSLILLCNILCEYVWCTTTLRTAHCALRTAHCALRTAQYIILSWCTRLCRRVMTLCHTRSACILISLFPSPKSYISPIFHTL